MTFCSAAPHGERFRFMKSDLGDFNLEQRPQYPERRGVEHWRNPDTLVDLANPRPFSDIFDILDAAEHFHDIGAHGFLKPRQCIGIANEQCNFWPLENLRVIVVGENIENGFDVLTA